MKANDSSVNANFYTSASNFNFNCKKCNKSCLATRAYYNKDYNTPKPWCTSGFGEIKESSSSLQQSFGSTEKYFLRITEFSSGAELRTLRTEVRTLRAELRTLAPPPPDDGSRGSVRLVHLLQDRRLTEFLEIAELLGYSGEDGLHLLTSLQAIAVVGGAAV